MELIGAVQEEGDLAAHGGRARAAVRAERKKEKKKTRSNPTITQRKTHQVKSPRDAKRAGFKVMSKEIMVFR